MISKLFVLFIFNVTILASANAVNTPCRDLLHFPFLKDWAASKVMQEAFAEDMQGSSVMWELKERGGHVGNMLVQTPYDWIPGESYGRPVLKPASLESLFRGINYFDEKTPIESRIYAAMHFQHKTDRTQRLWARIAVDPYPDPNEWEWVDLGEQVWTYNSLLASGLYPFSLLYFDHDFFGHIMAMRADPMAMAATRKLFQGISSHIVGGGNIGDILNEYLVVPNISQAEKIQKIFWDNVYSKELLKPDSVLASYQSFERQINKINFMVSYGESFLIRYGGAVNGARDTLDAERNWGVDSTLYVIAMTKPSYLPNDAKRGARGLVAAHSLMYVLHEMREIDRYLKLLSLKPAASEKTNKEIWSKLIEGDVEVELKDRMLRRLALLECAIVNGWKLGITPAKIIGFYIDGSAAGTDVDRYFKSYLPPTSIWYEELGLKP